MKKLTLLVLILALGLIFSGCGLFGFGSDVPDIQGTWNVTITGGGTGTGTLQVQQSGTSISGTLFVSPNSYNFNGTISSDTVEMDFPATGERMEASVNSAGTFMSNGRLYNQAGQVQLNWIAQKQ